MIDLKPAANPFSALGARDQKVPRVDRRTNSRRKRSRKSTQYFFTILAATFLILVIWGNIGTLDIASMASGEVIPSSQVKSIQHLEGGIVSQILVQEGQVVRKGQTLVRLEKTSSGADFSELEIRLFSLEAEIARLEAEASGAGEPSIGDELALRVPSIVEQAVDQFRVRKRDINNKTEAQQEAVIQRQSEVRRIQGKLANLRESLRLHKEKIDLDNKLLAQDLSSRKQHLELLAQEVALKTDYEDNRGELQKAEAALKEAQLNLDQIQSSYLSDVHNSLKDARSNYAELKKRLVKFQDNLSRTEITSPVDGIVKTLYVVTEGGVVRPGEPIVDVVPEGDRLIIEAKLPTHDIGYVQVGQAAAVKLASSDAARFSALEGTVVSISPDTLLTPDGMPYYKVRIATDKNYFERGDIKYQLYPGMQVVANVKIGTRSIFQYVFGPMYAGLDTALQER